MTTHQQDENSRNNDTNGQNAAVSLIRAKLAEAYKNEPNAREEVAEAEAATSPKSKHQQYIYQLNHSGKSLAEVQTAWHAYYSSLPDGEKHEVWREFYAAHEQASRPAPKKHEVKETHEQKPSEPDQPAVIPATTSPAALSDPRTEADIKRQLLSKIQKRGQGKGRKHRTRRKLSRRDHFKSLSFGLGMGALVIFILMFTFFNERFITPFITPSTTVSATPIIVDPSNNSVGPASEIIIPKINVEIPVLYNVASIDESVIQDGLEESVVHYPTTSNPGELGNGVIFGHSSSNIFNKGKYKFAFLQLHELVEGDTFYLNKGGKQYVYKVISKRVVPPTEVSVLTDTLGQPATFTLITCDPPGLNVNRLIVTGVQISPAPAGNQQSTATAPKDTKPAILPGNSESLWHRLTSWL